ncbi:hypothetical protein ABFT80_27885 [Mesorhizobium sp. SB112]|uniref:hypothetical protein n=1 Tax=Mesorhizobium sp. SB112 TaxID=3151853 RepID=UPI0032670756
MMFGNNSKKIALGLAFMLAVPVAASAVERFDGYDRQSLIRQGRINEAQILRDRENLRNFQQQQNNNRQQERIYIQPERERPRIPSVQGGCQLPLSGSKSFRTTCP